MNKQEKQLFFDLCDLKKNNNEEIKRLLNYATPNVLGALFYNRMQGVAYSVIKNNDLFGGFNREFRNSLKQAHEYNLKKNKSFNICVRYISNILKSTRENYALLKGAVLCNYYPEGCRTSNDIDILVSPSDISEVSKALLSNGFIQGNIKNGKIQKAERREIIESRVMRGETVPFVKEVNLPYMKYLEVDINFSLDYKNGDKSNVEQMIDCAHYTIIGQKEVKTLEKIDFFIHLCAHLYKEASTMPWIEMKRDMTLYKYCDIYMMLNDFSTSKVETLFERAKQLNLINECCFAIIQTCRLFLNNNNIALEYAIKNIGENEECIHTVISPLENKKYIFNKKDMRERFFSNNRRSMLKELE